jgi:hypothetical protein
VLAVSDLSLIFVQKDFSVKLKNFAADGGGVFQNRKWPYFNNFTEKNSCVVPFSTSNINTILFFTMQFSYPKQFFTSAFTSIDKEKLYFKNLNPVWLEYTQWLELAHCTVCIYSVPRN